MIEIKKNEEVLFIRMVIYIYIYIYILCIYIRNLKLGTIERKQLLIACSYIVYCMRYISNRCSSDKVVDLSNSKKKLIEESRMNYMDNNQVKIAILILFISSLCLS